MTAENNIDVDKSYIQHVRKETFDSDLIEYDVF